MEDKFDEKEKKEEAKDQMILTSYEVDDQLKSILENNFTYHKPIGDQQNRYILLRTMGKELAKMILTYTPPGREKSLALTKLEECVMWSNAAIARNEVEQPEKEAAKEPEEQVPGQEETPQDNK